MEALIQVNRDQKSVQRRRGSAEAGLFVCDDSSHVECKNLGCCLDRDCRERFGRLPGEDGAGWGIRPAAHSKIMCGGGVCETQRCRTYDRR